MLCQDMNTNRRPILDRRKTLQTLALVWSALRQGPGGRPLIKRAVVVAPTTITQNWAAECVCCSFSHVQLMRMCFLPDGPIAVIR